MKHEKGSFVLVPNKGHLIGMEAYAQCVFMWVCHFADERGECFPSRKTLARFAGCSISSVDRALGALEERGLLGREARTREGEKLTNLYHIVLLEGGTIPQRGGVPSEGRIELNPYELNPDIEANASMGVSYQPIDEEGGELVKYGGVTALKRKPPYPFSWSRELKAMQIAPQKVAKIVAHYVVRRGLSFDSYEQWYPEKARLLKEAVALKGYDGKLISKAMDYCEKKWPGDWKMSTVVKNISYARL